MKKTVVWIPALLFVFSFFTYQSSHAQCDDFVTTINAVSISCNGDCDGSLDVFPSGGTSPYTYTWVTGQTTQSVNGICAGYYCVTVTDGIGCTSVSCGAVDEPSAPSLYTYVIVPPSSGQADGAVGASVNGGTGPYTYYWDTGDFSPDIYGLPPGVYCVTVTDANGCSTVSCVELFSSVIDPVIEGPDQLCISECGTYFGYDLAGGGGGCYTYLWYDNGGTVVSTAQSIDYCPIGVGNIDLILEITDCFGYVAVTSYTITVVSSIPLEIVSTSPASCPDNNSTSACDKTCANSTITYTVPGSQNMELNWEVLGAESFEVDNNIVTVNWGGPGAGEINVSSGETTGDACLLQLNCVAQKNAPNGIAHVYHGFGAGPWTYQWSTGATSQTITGLDPGTYQVTVTNALGQSGVCEVLIQDGPPGCFDFPVAADVIAHPSCSDSNDGFIGLSAGPSYVYLWSNGANTSAINDLSAGIYCVTIIDNQNNCQLEQCYNICDPAPLVLNAYMMSQPSFPGGSDGVGGMQAYGGTPPYEYFWSGGNTGPVAVNLTEGSYSVVVSDANGCTASTSLDIYYSDICSMTTYIEFEDQPSSCYSADGSLTAYIDGGVGPYIIEWSDDPSITTLNRNNLSSGTYCINVIDANDCEMQSCITLDCNQNIIPVTCLGFGSLCIDIIDEPHAQFSSDPADVDGVIELCLGESVTFFNESENAENYVWDLGDGYATATVDVTHAYTSSGVYNVLLIARNECFCFDTTSVKVFVSEDQIPEIECMGTVCSDESVTYTTSADCNNFIWSVSANGTIVSGGGPTDDYVTVDWGLGPVGTVTLQVGSCTGNYCANPTTIEIPIITDNVFIEGPAKVCPGEIGTYSIPQWSATEYVWSASEFGEIKSGQGSNTVTIKWNVEMTTANQQWVHVEYNNCYLECGGESTKNVDITPDFYLAGPIEVCETGTSDYAAFDEIADDPVPCNWTVFDPLGAVYWTSPAPSPTASIEWPLGAGKYTLVAIAQNPDDFCSDEYTVFVNVTAGPPLVNDIEGQNSICPGEYYTYQAISTQPNVAFNWVINNGGVLSENAGSIINVEWGNSPPYSLTVTQTSTEGLACESQPFTMDIEPIASISLDGPTETCIEATNQYYAPTIGNAAYDWTLSPANAGTILSGQGADTIDVIWHEAGAAMVSVSVCGVTEDLAVNVYGYPEPVALHPDTICANETGLVSTSTPFSSYSWRNESGNQISSASSVNLGPGFYELVVTNNAGCEGQTTFRIHEYPLPVISISTPGLDFYCLSAGLPIPTLYALNTEEGYTYQWYQGSTPLGVFSNTFTPSGAGTYHVEVIDINGCTSISNYFTLIESCGGGGPPVPGVGCSGVSNIFSNGPTCPHGIFQNTSTNYVPGTVQWNFDDPASGGANFSNLENPEHFFTSAGFYGVQMSVQMITGGVCILHKPFEVPAQANFDFVNTCPGLPVIFEDISNFTPGSTVTSWDWDFGDPGSGADNNSNLQHPQHIYNDLGTYTVTLTINAQTGCSSTITRQVTVLPPPVASFQAPDLSCQATALAFNIDMNPGITSFEWDFDDPASGGANTSQLANTFHAFTAPGVYDVQLTVFNVYGCSDSTTLSVPIDQNNLSGDITMMPGSPICEGDSSVITAPPGGSSWIWSDGSVTESITYAEASTFEVTITDDMGCTYSPPTAVLDIIAQPEATIKVTEYNEYGQPADCFFNGYILCEGEDVFLSITGAGDYSYTWSSGQNGDEVIYDDEHGGTLEVGEHEFEVTVTDNGSGCTSVEGPFIITVNPVPTDIMIVSSPPGPICEQTTAVFTVSNPDPDLTYLWSTGDYGLTITASTVGEYFVRGISSFGCEGESNILEIYEAPDINLIPDGCHTRCSPDTVCLPTIPGIVAFQWYHNDVAIPAPEGTSPDFVPTESGSYYVDLFDVNGCNATSNPFSIDLLPLDTASIELGACEGGSVEYAGEILLPGTVTEFHFTNINGCDSMITVTVSEDINFEDDIPLSACENGSVIYEGTEYFPGTTTTLELSSQFGCDSVVNIIVASLPTHADSLYFDACMGTTINYEGEVLLPGTITAFNLVNEYGCDSIITVSVAENPVYADTVSLAGCEGTTVNYEGVDYPVGTSQTFELNTIAGCDSTIYLEIASFPVYSELMELSACAGTVVNLPGGLELEAGADTTLMLVSEFGCDSTVQITVDEVDIFELNIDLATCEGTTIEHEGTDYPPGTDLEFNYLSQAGCDSTVYLSVAALPVHNEALLLDACEGSTVEYNGLDLEPGTTTDVLFVNQFGCDSTMSVTVEADPVYADTVSLAGCEGTTVNYEGVDYPVGTSQTFELNTIAGCDSTIYLEIAAFPVYSELMELTACAGTVVNLPGGLELEAGADTTLMLVSEFGCDSTVQITVDEVDIFELNIDLATCEGTTIEHEGTDYPPGTDLEFNYLSQAGCDSTVYLSVAALPVHNEALLLDACEGTTVEYNGLDLEPGTTTDVLFVNQFGCDSTMSVTVEADPVYADTVSLAGCEGTTVNYEGVDYPVGTSQTFELNTIAGCDSTIYLEITSFPVYSELMELTACTGSVVNLPGGLELEAGADTTLMLVSEFGCDSTVQITVDEVDVFELNIDLATCEGTTIEHEGTDYPPGTDLEFNYLSQAGCDSTVYLSVAALPVHNEALLLDACEGTTVEYNGLDLETGTTTDVLFVNEFGCDSTMSVTVEADPIYADTVSLAGCEGTTVNYEGVDYPVGSSQTFELNTIAGCDSTIHLSIAAYPVYDELLELSACTGSVVNLPGGLQLEAGADTTLMLVSEFGCDSTVQITVEAVDAYEIDIELEGCEGSSVIFEGTAYPTGTEIEFNYTSDQGCDSTIYLSIAALPVDSSYLQLAACTGTTVEYNGVQLEPGTTTDFVLTNQFDCDSTVTVEVIEHLTYYEIVDMEGCEGGTIIFGGNSYPVGTTQEINYTTVEGCDSTILLNVAALPLSENDVALFACEGGTVEYVGDDLPAGSVTEYTFTNQFGCDSMVLVTVGTWPVQNETVDLSGCEGQTITFGGVDYPVGTQTVITLSNQYGCDSIINLNIAALPTYLTPVTLEVCAGETIEYDGTELAAGSITEFEFSSIEGCDSIVVVSVEAFPLFDYEVSNSDLICWNSDTAYIEVSALTGGSAPFNFSLDDINYQDSPLWNNLESGDYTVYVQDANGCVEEADVSIPQIPPIEMSIEAPVMGCDEDSVFLQSVLLNGLTDSMTYEWQHGVSGTMIAVYDPGVYVLDVSNLCEDKSFEVEVALEDGYRENYFYVPNAFSPNNDGFNDIFKAYAADGLAITSYELHLYDRWGNTLYSTTDISEGWNGIFLDEAMNPGVYVWWLRARVVSCRNEIEIFRKGDVTIIK